LLHLSPPDAPGASFCINLALNLSTLEGFEGGKSPNVHVASAFKENQGTPVEKFGYGLNGVEFTPAEKKGWVHRSPQKNLRLLH